MELVRNQKLDLYIRFPAGFDEAVAAYDMASGKAAPQVEVYYNSAAATSGDGYNLVLEILNQYESSLVNKFHVNWNGIYDLATQEDATGSIFSSMMPMLLLIFLFSGCMAVAPESIAGEKERGTIATLLITPTKRGSIALGKIMALSVISLLSGASSAIGTTLSLPKLMGAASEQLTVTYGVGDYALLGVVILSTVLLLITLISIVSAFAKSVKEAQTYVTPLMIVVILVGVTAMFGGGAKTELCYYLIPVYNSVQCMVGIFAFSASPVLILTAVAANLAVTGLGVFLLTRMFNSEGIMFSRLGYRWGVNWVIPGSSRSHHPSRRSPHFFFRFSKFSHSSFKNLSGQIHYTNLFGELQESDTLHGGSSISFFWGQVTHPSLARKRPAPGG